MARRTSTRAASPTTTSSTPAPTRTRGNGSAASATAVAGPAVTGRREPTADEIRRRAYEIYLERRGVGGSPESDWLQAERELRGR